MQANLCDDKQYYKEKNLCIGDKIGNTCFLFLRDLWLEFRKNKRNQNEIKKNQA